MQSIAVRARILERYIAKLNFIVIVAAVTECPLCGLVEWQASLIARFAARPDAQHGTHGLKSLPYRKIHADKHRAACPKGLPSTA